VAGNCSPARDASAGSITWRAAGEIVRTARARSGIASASMEGGCAANSGALVPACCMAALIFPAAVDDGNAAVAPGAEKPVSLRASATIGSTAGATKSAAACAPGILLTSDAAPDAIGGNAPAAALPTAPPVTAPTPMFRAYFPAASGRDEFGSAVVFPAAESAPAAAPD